jgi:hypothetical protein
MRNAENSSTSQANLRVVGLAMIAVAAPECQLERCGARRVGGTRSLRDGFEAMW